MTEEFLQLPDLQTAPPSSERPALTAGFVALSRFVIANGMTADVKAAFRNRPHLVDGASGYHRMEVISPVERPEEIWLLMFWADEASCSAWDHRRMHRESPGQSPRLQISAGENEDDAFRTGELVGRP